MTYRKKTFKLSVIAALLMSYCWLPLGNALAQKAFTTLDYSRADSLTATFNDKVFNEVNRVSWVPGKPFLWYETKTREGKEFFLVDVDKKRKTQLVEWSKFLPKLNAAAKQDYTRSKLPIRRAELTDDMKTFKFQTDTMMWEWDRVKNELKYAGKAPDEKPREYWNEDRDDRTGDPVKSPDGKWSAFTRDHNVFVKNAEGKSIQLSFDGSEGEYYSANLQWSPDSKKLAATRVRAEIPHYIYFVESSPADQFQPKLHKRYYPKPGDALSIHQPALFDVVKQTQIPVDATPYLNQYSLWITGWRKDSRAYTFEFNQRGHQRYQVVEVDAASGQCRVLIDEQSKTFIDYSGKHYRFDVDDGRELIWASERDGWNHLYLFSGDGSLKNQITRGEWVVREVVNVDEAKRQVIFAASGRNAGEDPYLIHYYRVGFDGTNMVELTPEPSNHQATFSSDFAYFVDCYSRVDEPSTTILRKASDGSIVMALERADISDLLKSGWRMPEVFSAKGRDDVTDIWGMIYRPTSFDSRLSYPIIEYIYAGPHSSHVPKSFRANHSWFSGLAELGFIVVQIDGMGTSNRSKAFHDVCWRNLKDAGFPDRIRWIRAAAAKYNYMDTSRVGIFGGSAGGQNSTGALLFHPEFYKVAVSSCGCHDNRMDKIWWNEQWMGYPIGPWYAENSNVVNAHRLKGKLMLMVGEVDDNVDPASTLQVCDALIKANKEFELVVLTGMNHTGGGKFGERKRRDFFVKHLLSATPPDWNCIGEH
jgi:dipeptidyl aminopeptidase/acylaminoacyl peptidase